MSAMRQCIALRCGSARGAVHILLMIRRLGRGGAERQLVILARELRRLGHDTEVALFYRGGELEPLLVEAGVPIRSIAKKGRYDLLGPLRRLRSVVREHGTDVIYTFLPTDNLGAAALKLVSPRTRIVWGMHSAQRARAGDDRFVRLMRRLEPRLARLTSRILAVSNDARAHAIERGFPSHKIAVVPNAIDVDTFSRDEAGRRAVRRSLDISDATPVIGIVARLVPIKDYPLFIRAVAVLHARRPGVRFVSAGDGDHATIRETHALAAKLNVTRAISFLGGRDDLAAVYSACDVVTLCSFAEGFGNVLGEAMACGVPCVATDVGAAREIVGDTGIIISTRDPEELARAWAELLDAPPSTHRERARQRIVERYSPRAVALGVAEVLAATA